MWTARILKTLAINCALALAVPIMTWCFSPSLSGRRFLQILWLSAIYSNSVGLFFGLFMDRIWIWTAARVRNDAAAWTLRVLAVLSFATLGTAIASMIIVLAGLIPGATFVDFFWNGYRFALILTFAITGVITFYETMKRRLEATTLQLKQKELERERALKLATESKLSSLESRIHPHFLFNTINSVSALIPEDPVKAERLLGRMSELLRFSLDSPQTGLVPLDRELRIVADYLEIEKARYGERLRYTVNAQPSYTDGVMVPPLSIQTLVENSVKYAVAPNREGGCIEVQTLGLPGGGMAISVADDGPGFDAQALQPGHGLALLDERLKTLFGEDFGIRFHRAESRWYVTFTVPTPNLCTNRERQ